MKKTKFVTLIVIVIAIIAGLSTIQRTAQRANTQKYVHSTTPTIFFHGWGSSSHAEEHMVNAAKRAGVTTSVIKANVDKGGRVTLVGHLRKQATNSIVMVNFADNKNSNYHQDGQYAYHVIQKLQATYHFKRVNLVGHSMGNMAISFYLLDHGKKSGLPKLNKQVAIAGHFDGIKGRDLPDGLKINRQTGQPNKMSPAYRELLGLRQTYPQHAKVLNIYGDIGDHSDGQVTNDSSRTMRYLVADRAGSYREKKISGSRAQHSKLHDNKEVDRILISFLWGK